jgi:hypothetical protein
MRTLHTQKGMGISGYLFVFIFIGLIATMALRLIPIYLENMGMQRAINQVMDAPDFGRLTKNEFYKRMEQAYYTNDVKSYNSERISKVLKMNTDKKTGQKQLELIYQVDAPFFKNVYLLVKFEKIIPVHKEGIDGSN